MSGSNDHNHLDDEEHDDWTVPPFVSENSVHDWVLSFMSLVACFCIVWLCNHWSGLPLASVEAEVKPEPINAPAAVKTVP